MITKTISNLYLVFTVWTPIKRLPLSKIPLLTFGFPIMLQLSGTFQHGAPGPSFLCGVFRLTHSPTGF